MTADDLADFEQHLVQRGVDPSTARQYRSHLVRPRERLLDKELAPSTRRVGLAAWKSYAGFIEDDALLKELKQLRLPVAARVKVQVPLPLPVWKALRAEIDSADYLSTVAMRCVLGVMANRGLRRGDVLRLRRTEVTAALRSNVLAYEAKGKKRLEFGLLQSYRRYIEQLGDVGGKWTSVYELISPNESWAKQKVADELRVCAEHIELGEVTLEDVRPHVLRRTFAVAMYEAFNHDAVKLAAFMGWSNVTTALRYVDFVKRDELDLVADEMMMK